MLKDSILDKFEASAESSAQIKELLTKLNSYLEEVTKKEKLKNDLQITEGTLQRVFGYKEKMIGGKPYNPSSDTLFKLAKCLDYNNWSDFLIKNNDYFHPAHIDCENIEKGKVFLVGWKPYNYMIFEAIGYCRFSCIAASQNYIVNVNQEFDIKSFYMTYKPIYKPVEDKYYDESFYPPFPTIFWSKNKLDEDPTHIGYCAEEDPQMEIIELDD